MDEELKHTELRLPEIKEYLYESVGKILESVGFRFKKSDFSFMRKRKDNSEKVFFLFYNYYPLNYEMHFLSEIWNQEVESVKSGFQSTQKVEKLNFRSLVMFMGDFLDECKNVEIGIRKGYTYKLAISTDLVAASERSQALIGGKLIPLLNQLTSVDGLDEYFFDDPTWSAKSLNLNNILTDLTVAKIAKRRDVAHVHNVIVNELNNNPTKKEPNIELINVIDDFVAYLDSRH